MVSDIIVQSWGIRAGESANPAISMSTEVSQASNILHDFLFDRVYNLQAVKEDTQKAKETVRLLYNYFNHHLSELPPEYSSYSDEAERRVVDYIAGMTDLYATRLAGELSLV
jgi:dGTPase